VGISKFTKRPLNFPNIPNQSLDFPPLLLPLNPLCSSAFRLCRRRRTSPLATALPSTPLTTSCFSFPCVTPLLPAALAEPCCLASRAPRSSRALAGRHLADRRPGCSRDHPFLSSFPSLPQTRRYYKPDQTPSPSNCFALSSSSRHRAATAVPHRDSPQPRHPAQIHLTSCFPTLFPSSST
jgi:hypothetical protein